MRQLFKLKCLFSESQKRHYSWTYRITTILWHFILRWRRRSGLGLFINLWVWLPGLLCPLHNHTTGITGWWTANKAGQSSSYIIYSFIYFCMRNTRWKSPANRAPVSPWTRQRRLYTKCSNISKQTVSSVSYTSAIKRTNLTWKINCRINRLSGESTAFV